MHPFLDGNGRTARALEALMRQRSGLRDELFIAMSNYYYEEKPRYLRALAEVRAGNHDLTPFLLFGLRGIARQCRRLFQEIRKNISKTMFQNVMYDLFKHLRSRRKRVIAERQLAILELLLQAERIGLDDLRARTAHRYSSLKHPSRTFIRDVNGLLALGALGFQKLGRGYELSVRLDWPAEITETDFFVRAARLPLARTHRLPG
jgi:Fic family protein